MNLFVDSSVALAASISTTGASRQVFDLADVQNWTLLVSPWVLGEVRSNLVTRPREFTVAWLGLRRKVIVEEDELTFDWPIVFNITKDKPVLCAALAHADVLLTLDRRDFQSLLGKTVYGLRIETPGEFLSAERVAGRIS